MISIRKTASVVCGAIILSLSLAGCGGGGGKGGDTTCGEFLQMSSSDQKAAVTALLSETDSSPSNGKILIAVGSAKLYCNTVGTNDSKIREING